MKKVLSVILAFVLTISVLPIASINVKAATYDANVVVDLALSKVSTNFANGYCLRFVKEMFASAYGFTSSACCAYKYGNSYIDSTSRNNIPLGASVFFAGSSKTCSTCGNKCGHIGIYVGNDYVVHGWGGKIVKYKIDRIINAGYPYRGWGWHGNVELSSDFPVETTPSNSTNPDDYSFPTRDIFYKSGSSVMTGNDVKWVQSVLYQLGYTIVVDGSFGPATRDIVKQFQSDYGLSVDGSVGPTTRTKLLEKWNNKKNGNISISLHTWFSDAEFGDLPDKYIAGNRVYLCYELVESNTGERINSLVDKSYSATLTLYNPDGSVFHTNQVDSDDNSWISVVPREAGTYRGTISISGDVNVTGNVSFVLVYDALLNSSLSSFALNLNGTNTKTSTITVSGGYPGKYGARYSIGDSSIASASWGDWNGNSIPITVTGKKTGTTNIVISLYENYTGNQNVVKTITIPISVVTNDYTVGFNANGGSVSPSSKTVTYSSTYGTLPTPARTGYSFVGWYTSSTGGTQVTSNTTVTTAANHTLYAHWSATPYTITYNANGGSGAPNNQTKYHGTNITLSSTAPTRSGYTFLGWSTSSTATSATYQPGSTFSSNANTTLYAVWKANATYSITYHAYGGSGAPSAQTGSTSYTISGTVPTRFGYTFLGWATSAGATTATYEPGDAITISGNTTLYAVWKSATTLSVGASNSAKIDFSNQEVYYAFTPASSGTYTFESTGSVDSKIYVYNASGTELDNDDDSSDEGTNFKLTMNLTGGTKYFIKVRAYSSYTGTISFSTTGKYTVTYNANGGSNAPANQTKTHGTALTLSTTVPSRSGYTFKGWATSSTSTSATYQPGGTYSSNANITLYAVWEGGQYTISYNANGGSGAPSSQTKTYGQSLTLSTTTPIRPGYKFKGWATSSTATSANYQPGASFTNNADITLYAVWEYKEYPVWFYANLGTGAPEHQVKLHDQPLILPDTKPSRQGYTFLGWSTDTDATSAMYQPGGTYSSNSSISLYAVWQKKTVSSISISSPPTKTVYYVGDDLNTSGLKIKVTYSDGTYEDITSGNDLSMSYNMTIVGTRTVNVKFEGKSTTFNITIKAPTISLSETTKTVIVDDTATITATTDPAGQTVTWSSSNTNVVTVVNGVVTAKEEGVATITAKFTYNGKEYSETCDVTVAAETYIVSYNANGGSGAPSSQTKTYCVNLTLSSTKPTRTGYTFLGWATSSTATSATYQPGGSFTSDANTTLYAVWEANTYSVKYNANGGSGTMSNSSHTYDASKALSSNAFSRTGYTFLGWSTSSSATSATYTNSQSVKNLTAINGGTVNLYAVWQADEPDVLLGDVNGDNEIDAGDAVIISRYDAGFITLTEAQLVAADVNKDGFVDAGDAVVISRYDAGFISSLN